MRALAVVASAGKYNNQNAASLIRIVNPAVYVARLNQYVAARHTQFLLWKNKNDFSFKYRDVVDAFLFVQWNVAEITSRRDFGDIKAAANKAFAIGITGSRTYITINRQGYWHISRLPEANNAGAVQFHNIATRVIRNDYAFARRIFGRDNSADFRQ